MIMLYSGTPGSGKSLHAAHDLYHYLNKRKERKVICNFDLNLERVRHPERFHYCDNVNLTPEYVISECYDFFRGKGVIENQVVLIIDECQLIFNARKWNENGRDKWLSFFSQHRKYGVLCILIAQFDFMIDKQIRALIEYEVIHRKLTNFGFLGNLIKIFSFGEVFVAVERWYTINQKTGSYYFKAKKKYYNLYDTFNTFSKDNDMSIIVDNYNNNLVKSYGDDILDYKDGYV